MALTREQKLYNMMWPNGEPRMRPAPLDGICNCTKAPICKGQRIIMYRGNMYTLASPTGRKLRARAEAVILDHFG